MEKNLEFTVIKDTREKDGKGWSFEPRSRCKGTVIQKMDEGDYTLEGFEKLLCIERKGGVAEFAANVTQKRFVNELERMRSYKYGFIILEFNMRDVIRFPVGSGIPKHKLKFVRMNSGFFLKKTIEIISSYPTNIIFADNYGSDVAMSIFNRVVENDRY